LFCPPATLALALRAGYYISMSKKIILVLVVLVLALGVGFYIYKNSTSQNSNDNQNNQPEQLKQIQQLEHPNLDKPVNITVNNMPEDAQKIARQKIADFSAKLRDSNDWVDGWLQLAIYRKMIGDYEAARDIWNYVALIAPKSPTPFNNLGDLYFHFMVDYKKAEENFLKAIEIDPHALYVYRNIYELYHYGLKDDAKAKAILEKGITANPGASQDLKYLLDNL